MADLSLHRSRGWSRAVALCVAFAAQPVLAAVPVPHCQAPVTDTAISTRTQLDQLATSGRGYAADLSSSPEGTLLEGASREPLSPGRYRLHLPLALAPISDPRTSSLHIQLQAGGAQRTLNVLHFEAPGRFVDATLDFVVVAGKP